jgi:hypothetical protein
MPRGQQGANVRPGDIWSGGPDLSGGDGLLYQPWSKEYGDKYVPENIWDYQPPELTVGRPEYSPSPIGIMEVTDYVPPSESESDDDYDWANDPEGRKGGKMPGDIGYGTSSPTGDIDIGVLAGLFGLTDFADWGDKIGAINAGGEEADNVGDWGDPGVDATGP